MPNRLSTNDQKVLDYLRDPISYVSGGDGELFINNVLVDECYDIQYSYREMKEPIYGYRSQYFNEVLAGTVLITGQFTINYIHDGYLYSILNADKQFDNYINSDWNISNLDNEMLGDGYEYKTKLQQYNELRKVVKRDANTLADMKVKKAILDQQVIEMQTIMERERTAAETVRSNIAGQENKWIDNVKTNPQDTQEWVYDNSEASGHYETVPAKDPNPTYDRLNIADDAWRKYQAMLEVYEVNKTHIENNAFIYVDFSLVPSIQSDWSNLLKNNDWDITKHITLNNDYKRAAEELIKPGWFNTDESDYAKFQQSKLNADAEERNVTWNLRQQLIALKERQEKLKAEVQSMEDSKINMTAIDTEMSKPKTNQFAIKQGKYMSISSLSALQATAAGNTSLKVGTNYRPENTTKNTKFQIKFNGLLHKELIGVHLVGHTHFFGVGGEVIKESYTFLAQRLV
jgi:hypothetical protein